MQVLEARDRRGGRSYSEAEASGPWAFEHDAGGMFQHGSSLENTITWFAQRFDIESRLGGGSSDMLGGINQVRRTRRARHRAEVAPSPCVSDVGQGRLHGGRGRGRGRVHGGRDRDLEKLASK